jgi:amidohydrolase
MPTFQQKQIFANIDSIAARAIEIRHDLHRNPQVAYQETYAQSVICKELQRLEIQFTTNWAGGTGVVALVPGTLGTGKCVALRADMDALPVTEATDLPYASQNPGFMHACGHDGHMAVLLGAAAILQQHAGTFAGTVKLIFQPAEEGGCGAEKMCQEGVLEKPKVDAIFGLHGWPGLKVGMVATKGGALLASVDGFTITVKGRGGHAATPQDTADPIVCAAAMVQSLQTIVSREADPLDASVLTISQINAGTAFNVIPDHAQLSGSIRALTKTRREATLSSLERICRGIAAAHRCTVEFSYFGATPCTNNTPELAEFVHQAALRSLGPGFFSLMPKPAMWGEDFAFYLERVPGCFFVLGVRPPERSTYPMLHHPCYDFTDASVPLGIRMMTDLALGWLGKAE